MNAGLLAAVAPNECVPPPESLLDGDAGEELKGKEVIPVPPATPLPPPRVDVCCSEGESRDEAGVLDE